MSAGTPVLVLLDEAMTRAEDATAVLQDVIRQCRDDRLHFPAEPRDYLQRATAEGLAADRARRGPTAARINLAASPESWRGRP